MFIFRKPVLVLCGILFWVCPLHAKTLAVFPFLDITLDQQGYNPPLTESVRVKASEYGFSVVPANEVMNFMVRHRIRSLGTLTTYDIVNLRQELGVDFALVGTVCQLNAQDNLKISLNLELIRTVDEEVVWSVIKVMHKNDLISLLGLWDPETLNDIYKKFFPTLFDSIMPNAMDGGNQKDKVGVLDVNIRPTHLKPRQRIQFSLKYYTTSSDSVKPSFKLLLGEKSIPVTLDDESHSLNAIFQAPDEDGSYKVDLLVELGSDIRRSLWSGSITVDSVPPELSINLIGDTINGKLYFRQMLDIIPILSMPERLSGWDIAVYDENDEMIASNEAGGNLPPSISWNGTTSATQMAVDGLYRIKLRVRDLAGNQDDAEGTIIKMATSPQLNFEVTEADGNVRIIMENDVNSVPLEYWWIKVFQRKGEVLKIESGDKLPATIEIPLPTPNGGQALDLIAGVQDKLGNNAHERINDIMQLGQKDVETEIVPETKWLENF